METIENQTSKKWYWKLAGCFGIFVAIVLILSAIAFGLKVRQAAKQIKSGEVSPEEFTLLNEEITVTKGQRVVLETDDDPQTGPKDALVTIVEFSSFECPFCRQSYPIVRELSTIYKDKVRFIYRDFAMTKIAQKAAEAGECAQDQNKFWPLHDKIFQNQERISMSDLKLYARQIGLDEREFNQCLDSGKYQSEVAQDFTDGLASGVKGTPTWFINGQKVEGVIPREYFKKIIDGLLVEKDT